MTEAFLHYLWQHRLFTGPLVTTDGKEVEVVRVGYYNHNSGPDFSEARVCIDGIQWVGQVEIHIKATDWNLHRHNADAAYNNVILHLVYINDGPVVTQLGQPMPTVEVQHLIPEDIWSRYSMLIQPQIPIAIPCMLQIQEVPQIVLESTLDRMLVERLQRKASDVQRLLDDSRSHWETTCYCMVARYLGGKVNAFAFEMLAKVTPLSIIAKIKDNPFRIEALLFGQAGMLEGAFNDAYPQRLQKEYQYLRIAYKLTPMDAHLWHFFRLRPANFPTIRIAQLASLLASSSNLFSRLLDIDTVDELRRLFDYATSPYWVNHYRFDVESAPIDKRLGTSFVDILLINAWIPLLFEYGVQHDDDTFCDRAVDLLQQLPAEKNHIVKQWASAHIVAHSAHHSQALLQLYNEYCTPRLCLQCPIGHHLLSSYRTQFTIPPVLQEDATEGNNPPVSQEDSTEGNNHKEADNE